MAKKGYTPEAIMPARAASLRTLTIAMAVMCYLACLAAGGLVLINRSVDAWKSDLAREVTVQIREIDGRDMEREIARAVEILEVTVGVLNVKVLTREEAVALLEPWLGNVGGLGDLPIPRLITVTIDPEQPPDLDKLEKALSAEIPGASLDTHKRWQTELTRMASVLTSIAFAILGLIGFCAIAIVVFATRSALESNREVVAVLHLVGARDGFIARQVWSRFLKTGLTAGLIGLTFGLGTFFVALNAAPESFSAIGREYLSFSTAHFWGNYAALAAVPLVATFISLVTSRMTLLRILKDLR
jgi:cell division transport system permease protein